MRSVAALAVAMIAGCAAPAAPMPASPLPPPPPRLDPAAPGAAYLTALAGQLQPRWRDFLEDCRTRLPPGHALNQPGLVAVFELSIDRSGRLVADRELASSGNGDFDTAVADVLADASALPAPPDALISDDEQVHVRWQFARDRRQAGPAGARLVRVALPLATVVAQLLGRGALGQAARRVAAADGDRGAAAEQVMIAALREALASADGAARRTAVEACGRAGVQALAAAVREQLGASDPELQRAAIAAAGALGDRAAAPALLGALRDDLALRSPDAAGAVTALVAIGHAADAARALRAGIDAAPDPAALAAVASLTAPAIAALAGLGPRLDRWLARGDAALRGAVCAALPAAAPAAAVALVARGLRDPDARVRARCASAAGREDPARPDGTTLARLRVLARDRDLAVRAQAVAALGALDPAHPVRAADDPAAAVRAAFAAQASELELRALTGDPEPEVRAAALRALGDRGHAAALAAAADPSPVVRRVAVAALAEPGDAAVLARLAGDDSPEVASAALIRLAGLRGRAAATGWLLDQLAAAPAGSAERARIALAWLLAR